MIVGCISSESRTSSGFKIKNPWFRKKLGVFAIGMQTFTKIERYVPLVQLNCVSDERGVGQWPFDRLVNRDFLDI